MCMPLPAAAVGQLERTYATSDVDDGDLDVSEFRRLVGVSDPDVVDSSEIFNAHEM